MMVLLKQITSIITTARNELSAEEYNALSLEQLNIISNQEISIDSKLLKTDIDCLSESIASLYKELKLFLEENKQSQPNPLTQLNHMHVLIDKREKCLNDYNKFLIDSKSEKERIAKRLALEEKIKKKCWERDQKIKLEQEEKERIAEAKLELELSKEVNIPPLQLKQDYLTPLILHIESLYPEKFKNQFICSPRGNTKEEKAKFYETDLRERKISEDVPLETRNALAECIIARYQLNLMDEEDENGNQLTITTTLPRPLKQINRNNPNHFKKIAAWAIELQKTLHSLLLPHKQEMTIVYTMNDLKCLIKKTLCHPDALLFWKKQTWGNQTVKIPKGIKDLMEALTENVDIKHLQQKTEEILTHNTPFFRSKATQSYYQLIARLKWKNSDDINESIISLNKWITKNDLKMNEKTELLNPVLEDKKSQSEMSVLKK